jgi:CRP-like cAMP-binding protein
MDFWQRLVRRASLKALGNLEKDETYSFLREHALFRELSPPAFLFLHDCMIERRYNRNEIIFAEGTPGVCLFLVRTGRVEVFASHGAEPHASRTIYCVASERQIFGELSMVSMSYRTRSAKALDPGTAILALSLYDLKALEKQHPADALRVLKGITETMAHNLLDVSLRLREVERDLTNSRAQSSRPASPASESLPPASQG